MSENVLMYVIVSDDVLEDLLMCQRVVSQGTSIG